MITFKQFLAEEKQDLIKFLRDNCDQAVHDMFKADRYLWRGANKRGDRIFTFGNEEVEGYYGFPRENRKPRNTPKWAHDFFNEYFKREFGEPIRSTAVFCYGNRVTAGGYGSVFAVIPIGRYSIVSSDNVQDLTTLAFPDLDEDNPDEAFAGGLEHFDKKDGYITRKMEEDYLEDLLDNAGYKESSIVGIKRTTELMVKCKSYLALSISDSELTQVIADAAIDETIEQ